MALRKPMTREAFFAWAEAQDRRYEFDGTAPVAMTGGTNKNGVITRNLNGQLYLRLRGGTCQSMPAEGGGIATTAERVRYPEAAVSCTPFRGNERLLPDPVVVFEVARPSTRRIDQVLKLREYHAVASIRRYVLLGQSGVVVTVHAREDAGAWVTSVLLAGDVLAMPEIGIEIPLSESYEGSTFDDLPP